LFFVPAALVPLAAYFVTNWLATGGWKPFYMYYGTEKYEYVHEGVPSYWMNPQGLDRAVDSPLVYFLHCTVGHHGILSLSPIFLLTLVGWGMAIRDAVTGRTSFDFQPRAVLWLGMGLTVAVLGFYMLRTENYNYGGNTAGLRWMFWLIPFWLVAMIPVLDRWGGRRWFRATAAGLLGVSVFSAMYPLDNPWRHPWLFQWMQRQGWLEQYRDRPPPDFDRALTTWITSLPDSADSDPPVWIEFAGPDFDGRITQLRLSDAGSREYEGRLLRRIRIEWNPHRDDATTAVWHIDAERFDAGAPPSDFLVWPDGPPTDDERAEAIAFLTGLPRQTRYRAGPVRHMRTALRRDAFEAQLARAGVLHQPEGSGRRFRYQADVWVSREIPFGVLSIETTVSGRSGEPVLSRRRLVASRVGGGVIEAVGASDWDAPVAEGRP
jgi:hypothetical protein